MVIDICKASCAKKNPTRTALLIPCHEFEKLPLLLPLLAHLLLMSMSTIRSPPPPWPGGWWNDQRLPWKTRNPFGQKLHVLKKKYIYIYTSMGRTQLSSKCRIHCCWIYCFSKLKMKTGIMEYEFFNMFENSSTLCWRPSNSELNPWKMLIERIDPLQSGKMFLLQHLWNWCPKIRQILVLIHKCWRNLGLYHR